MAMKNKHTWGWPIASYLFLGGLGGGMLIISSAADLFFHKGDPFALGTLVAVAAMASGSGMLIFDLGRRFYFWRVFSRPKAILAAGAWMLSLAIICGLIFSATLFDSSPWYQASPLRQVFAWINLLLGVGVAIYTGVFLGTMKARPFWNSPELPVLFLISAISSGLAAQLLIVHFWASGATGSEADEIATFLRIVNIGLLLLEFVALMVSTLIMRYSSDTSRTQIAATWLNGSKRVSFWALVSLGLVLPIIFYSTGNSGMIIAAIALVLMGGIIHRFLVVYTDDRVLLPGEEEFLRWLPGGDEEFLRAKEE
jgi:formate-dependent nitrite reductase membrane component NrfD